MKSKVLMNQQQKLHRLRLLGLHENRKRGISLRVTGNMVGHAMAGMYYHRVEGARLHMYDVYMGPDKRTLTT